jgi:hypothetical protein
MAKFFVRSGASFPLLLSMVVNPDSHSALAAMMWLKIIVAILLPQIPLAILVDASSNWVARVLNSKGETSIKMRGHDFATDNESRTVPATRPSSMSAPLLRFS